MISKGKKIIVVSILIAVMLLSVSTSITTTYSFNGAKKYTTSDPIVIDADSDFDIYASSGNGSKSNPYIIENLSIVGDDPTVGEGISIISTSKYFIIRDNYITGFDKGIYIGNVADHTAYIDNNTVDYCQEGLHIDTNHANITNNIFQNCYDYGIYFMSGWKFTGIDIINNTFTNCTQGMTEDEDIDLYDVSIINNTFSYCTEYSIDFFDLNGDLVIQNNNFTNGGGFRFQHGVPVFENCVFINEGIIPWNLEVTHFMLDASSFPGTTVNGLDIGVIEDQTDVTITTNYGQLFISNTNDSVLQDIEINATSLGIALYNCHNFTISNVSLTHVDPEISATGFSMLDNTNVTLDQITLTKYKQAMEIDQSEYLGENHNYTITDSAFTIGNRAIFTEAYAPLDVQGCVFSDYSEITIQIGDNSPSGNLTSSFVNCDFLNGHRGIYGNRPGALIFDGCTFTNFDERTIYVGNYYKLNYIITNTEFTDVAIGIELFVYNSTLLFTDNTLTNVAEMIKAYAHYSEGWIIQNNIVQNDLDIVTTCKLNDLNNMTFSHNVYEGTLNPAGSNHTIQYNDFIIDSNAFSANILLLGDHADYCNNTYITGNTFTVGSNASHGTGINVESSSNTTISNNIFTNLNTGIEYKQGNIYNTMISNNTFDNITKAFVFSPWSGEKINLTFIDNHISNCYTSFGYIELDGAPVTGIKIINNTFVGTPQKNDHTAIRIQDQSGTEENPILISNNTFQMHGVEGILLTGETAHAKISHNSFEVSSQAVKIDDSCSYIDVHDNYFYLNWLGRYGDYLSLVQDNSGDNTNWNHNYYMDHNATSSYEIMGSYPDNKINAIDSNPILPDDTDGDGLDDLLEAHIGTDPNDLDTDGDTIEDGFEYDTWDEDNIQVYRYLDPLNASDGSMDYDNDTLTNAEEINDIGTNYLFMDTDFDGMPDAWEHENDLDPLTDDAADDADDDNLSNLDEYREGTDPNDPDTDGDGWKDGVEVHDYNNDPLDPNDYPKTEESPFAWISLLIGLISLASLRRKKSKS